MTFKTTIAKSTVAAACAAVLAVSGLPATALADSGNLKAGSISVQASAPSWVSKGFGKKALTSFSTSEVALSGGRIWHDVKAAGSSVTITQHGKANANASRLGGMGANVGFADGKAVLTGDPSAYMTDGEYRGFRELDANYAVLGATADTVRVAKSGGKLVLGLDTIAGGVCGGASSSAEALRKKLDAKVKPSDYNALPAPMEGYIPISDDPAKAEDRVTKSELAYIKKAAKSATAGCKTDVQKAEKLFFEWFPGKFTYGDSGAFGYGYSKLVKKGTVKADASEIAQTYAWMLRAAGVPALYIMGSTYIPNSTDTNGWCWCAVYLDGHWRFCDPAYAVYLKNRSFGEQNNLVAYGAFCPTPSVFGMEHRAMGETSSAATALKRMLKYTQGKNNKKASASKLKSQSLKVSVSAKGAKAKALKKRTAAVATVKAKGAKTKVTFAKKSGSKRLYVDKKSGKVYAKKETKKGVYKCKVKATAAKSSKYKAASKTVAVKVRVR